MTRRRLFASSTALLPRIVETAGVPIHLYAESIEPQALEQVQVLAESPLPTDYVAVMPDAHLGVRNNNSVACEIRSMLLFGTLV